MPAEGSIDAAQYFDGRLPEAFGGYDRKLTGHPVGYPAANAVANVNPGQPSRV